MVTLALPKSRQRLRDTWTRVVATSKARSRPIRRHLADHAYTLAGFGFISAASYVHSLFTGLLVTGILFLVFEFKVGE
jgi:hypothetical protein